jgi:hypothetical protein
VFSINAAETLIATTPRDTQHLDVGAWATAYGLTHLDDPNPRTVSLIGPASNALNRAYAMTTDLTKPVIVGHISVTGHPPTPLLIDGHTGSTTPGVSTYRGCPLTSSPPEETRQIQDTALLGPQRTSITPPSS